MNFNLATNVAQIDFRAQELALFGYYNGGRFLFLLNHISSSSSLLFYQFGSKIALAIKISFEEKNLNIQRK